MIQSFIVWLLGPQLAGLVGLVGLMAAIFLMLYRCIEGKWWWEAKRND